MKIILKENIRNLGNVGDIVNVKEGYFSNYLLPRKKACCATEEEVKKIEKNLKILQEEHEKKLLINKEIFTKINGIKIHLKILSSESGVLYSGVSREVIKKALEEKIQTSVEIDCIFIHQKIKNIGEYIVDIHLYGQEKTFIKVEITSK